MGWNMQEDQRRKQKKSIRLLLLFVCIAVVIGVICYQKKIGPFAQSTLTHPQVHDSRSVKKTQSDFDKLIQEFFKAEVTDNTITLNYTLKNKENYGITEAEPTLGEYSLKEMKNSLAVSENRVATLETYDYEKLTKEQKLIYDMVYILSKQNLESADFLEYGECLGPTTGIQAQLPIYFAEYSFRSKVDVDEYIKLLGLVPKYFEEILAFEQNKSKKGIFMSDTTVQAIIDQCSEFIKEPEKNYLITMFDGKVLELSDLTDAEKTAYSQQNKDAVLKSIIPAYQTLIDGLTKLKGTGKNDKGLCNLKKGKEYYAYLVKAKTGSSRSLSEINALLDDTITDLKKSIAKTIADSPDVYYDAQKVTYKYDTPQKAMEHLKEAIAQDFPALEDDIVCEIKYVDKSLEDSMSPAFYLTPAFDDYKNNIVYINQNERYDLSKAFTTIGHETYPGHLYQTCYFDSTNPNPLRNVVNISGYSEGWGTYAELYSYDLSGIDKKVSKLLKDNTLATLCLYAKADLGIHYLGWDEKKLQTYMTDFGFSKSSIKAIYESLIAEPASYMPYTIGYLEIKALQQKAEDKLGKKFVIKDFHEFYLSIGPVPFDVIEDRLDDWIETKIR